MLLRCFGIIGVEAGQRLLRFLLRASTAIPGIRYRLGWI